MYSPKIADALRRAIGASEDWASDGWTMLFPSSSEFAQTDEAACVDLGHARDIAANPAAYPGVDAERALAYWLSVEAAGEAAAELGREAVDAYIDGDITTALALCRNAAQLEQEFGDDPTWAPVVRALARTASASTYK